MSTMTPASFGVQRLRIIYVAFSSRLCICPSVPLIWSWALSVAKGLFQKQARLQKSSSGRFHVQWVSDFIQYSAPLPLYIRVAFSPT
jgi:hypothetical protein